jgi:phage gpG-like protein
MIGLQITGDTALLAKFDATTGKVRAAAKSSLDMWATELAGYIKMSKLSGNPLHRRSGKLSSSVYPDKRETAGTISGGARAGLDVPYAKAHEYGMQRNVVVSAFHRMQTMAWGKPMANPREVLVNQHSSYVNLPERSYMRSALREQAPEGIAELRAAVREAIA